MSIVKTFIKLFPVLGGETHHLVNSIINHSSHKTFKAGDQFYTQGDECPGITFLISGEIRVFMVSQTGREITLYHILPGETCVLNASCIISKSNYMANAVAIEDGAMLYLSREMFHKLMTRSEKMQLFIFSFFSQRFSEIIELVEDVTFGKMDKRLADFLIEKAENDELNITHQTIANELGSSREVISRLLKDFERRGLIELGRHHILLRSLIAT
jgi:CRP/FNR family transcriptional regulator